MTAYMQPTVEYQWKTTIAWWKEFTVHCKKHGIEQVAIEEFPCQMVYNPETLWTLRNAVDPIIGINLDPSHLIALGADPIASARALKGAIYHLHGKDARIERGLHRSTDCLSGKLSQRWQTVHGTMWPWDAVRTCSGGKNFSLYAV